MSKPGDVRPAAATLLTKVPVATSSTSESANCPATSHCCTRAVPGAFAPLLAPGSPRSERPGATFDMRIAGRRPNAIAVSEDTAAANRMTRPSGVKSAAIRSALAKRRRSSGDHSDSNRLPRPPSKASSRLSARSWRKSCQRPAPSAVLIAISRCRPTPRAISRLATFAQAMKSTASGTAGRNASAPSSLRSSGFVPRNS